MAHCTEELEVESRFSRVGGTVYRGRKGVIAWWNDLAEAWSAMEVETEDSVDVGSNRTVLLIKLYGKGRESGLRLDEPLAHCWHWSGERLRQLEYMDRDEAELIARADA